MAHKNVSWGGERMEDLPLNVTKVPNVSLHEWKCDITVSSVPVHLQNHNAAL